MKRWGRGRRPAPTRRTSADPAGQTFALLTVDWNLPDARQELVPLHQASLAVVPTYVVGEPVAPAAAAPTDARQDLSLTAVVVGLDEPDSAAPASARPPAAVWKRTARPNSRPHSRRQLPPQPSPPRFPSG